MHITEDIYSLSIYTSNYKHLIKDVKEYTSHK